MKTVKKIGIYTVAISALMEIAAYVLLFGKRDGEALWEHFNFLDAKRPDSTLVTEDGCDLILYWHCAANHIRCMRSDAAHEQERLPSKALKHAR